MNDIKEKLDAFQKEVTEKFEDPKFLKKFNNYIKKIEEMVDCEVKFEILPPVKLQNELKEMGYSEDLDVEGNEYWNRYSTTLRELNEYYIDIQNRTVFYSFDIEQSTPFFLETKIKTIEALNPITDDDEDKHIKLHISSYGGDAYGMLGTVDVIRLSKNPIMGIVKGQVMSAGAFILIACHYRVMSKNSIMMLHDLSTTIDGAFKDITSEYDNIKTIQKIVYQFLEENSNKDKEWWETKLQRNLYLTPKEAQEYGLIDEII